MSPRSPWTRLTCVYQIRHLASSAVYVGSTSNMAARASQHRDLLRRNRHFSTDLLQLFRRDGFNGLIFEVLEVCSQADLKIKEHAWMEKLKPRLLNEHVGVVGYQRRLSLKTRSKLASKARLAHQQGCLGRITWRTSP